MYRALCRSILVGGGIDLCCGASAGREGDGGFGDGDDSGENIC